MKVCLIPMSVRPARHSANLGRALDWMEQAAAMDPAPDLIVFPECMDLGWPQAGYDPAMVEPRGGPFVESLAERARGLGLYLVAGVTERENQRIFSCVVLIDPDGDSILRYRRIVVGPKPNSPFSPGSRLEVRRTPLGCVGLLAGQDLRRADLIGALGLMGADLVIAPVGLFVPGGRAGKSKEPLRSVSWPQDTRIPSLLSVAATVPADAAGKPKGSARSFYRDAAGKVTPLNESGAEEIISVEVKL